MANGLGSAGRGIPVRLTGGGSKIEEVLRGFVQEVEGLYGEDLIAIFLYGSAASGEHIRGRSDINVGVVLRHLTPPLLRKATGHVRTWHRRGFASPLFLDPDFLHASLEAFPIEFLDMQERHRTLWGQDPFADLCVGRGNLRLQCEQELRGKLLKLRQTYVESAGAPRDLERVLMAALSSVVVLARTLLRLGGGDPGGGAEVILERTRVRFGASTAALGRAWQLKRGNIRLKRAEVEALYQEVLEEVQGLLRVLDGLAA